MIWDDVGRCGCGRIGIILGLVVKISLVTGRLELLLYCYMSDRWPIESRPSWPSTMKPCNVGTLQEIHTYHISIIFYNIQYIYIYLYIYIQFSEENHRNQVLCWENWIGTCPRILSHKVMALYPLYVSKVLDLLTWQIIIMITIYTYSTNQPSSWFISPSDII